MQQFAARGLLCPRPNVSSVDLAKVFELADAVPARWRALILLAAFAPVRWGELVGLRRVHADLDACTVRVAKSGIQPDTGFRTVSFPDLTCLIFGHTWTASSVRGQRISYSPARVAGGLAGTTSTGSGARLGSGSACRRSICTICGSTYAAEAGATLHELMKRMGHSTPMAAMIYMHAREERDRQIADRMGTLAAEARKAARPAVVEAPDGSAVRPADRLPEEPRGHAGARPEGGDDAAAS